jgi:hypothetical protein
MVDQLLTKLIALVLIAGAGVIPLLERDTDDLLVGLLMFAGGLVLLAMLVRRTVRGGYVLGVWGPGFIDLKVSTTSVPYFVLDLVWLSFGAVWAYHAFTDPDPALPWLGRGASATILVVTVLLLVLRVRCRLRR